MNDRLKELIRLNKEKIKKNSSIQELYGKPFEELLELISPVYLLLMEEESKNFIHKFCNKFPITFYGRIDWSVLNGILAENIEEIISNEKINLDTEIFIIFNDGSIPVLKTKIEKILKIYDNLSCIGFDQWIITKSDEIMIELYHEGEIKYWKNSTIR